jgi:hypothetical protein
MPSAVSERQPLFPDAGSEKCNNGEIFQFRPGPPAQLIGDFEIDLDG